MNRILLPSIIFLFNLLVQVAPVHAQCSGPLAVTVQGAGTGLPLSVQEMHVNAQCPGDNGSVTISASGGSTPYTGIGTFPQAAGMHTYTVVDMKGCSSSVVVTITANPRPTGHISGSDTICGGESSILTLSVTGSGHISGTLSDGTSFDGTAPTIQVSVSPLSTTVYTISTLEDENCSSTNAQLSGTATVMVRICTQISGKLIWEGNRLTLMSGVANATVKLTGDALDMDVTGAPGTYTLDASTGSNFMVTPTKNQLLPNALNGVTAADASRIQMHVSGSLLLKDPYKLIAADVNKSNNITAADATLVQQAILGYPEALQYFYQATWRFVPKSYVFPVPTNPWFPAVFPEKITISGMTGNITGKDFIGVKLGDVNNSANPAIIPGLPPALELRAADHVLVEGETFVTTVKAHHFQDILALQFGLKFNPEHLELVAIESLPGSPFAADNFGLNAQQSGAIPTMLAFTEGRNYQDGTGMFNLVFKAKNASGLLSEHLELNDDVLVGEPYNSTFTPGKVSLVFEGNTVSTDNLESESFKLVQITPNPFSANTTVGFQLPESCNAQIMVFDAEGKMVYQQKFQGLEGYQTREIRIEAQVPSSMLYMKLVTPFGTLMEKMTLAR